MIKPYLERLDDPARRGIVVRQVGDRDRERDPAALAGAQGHPRERLAAPSVRGATRELRALTYAWTTSSPAIGPSLLTTSVASRVSPGTQLRGRAMCRSL